MPRLFLGNFDCEYDWGASLRGEAVWSRGSGAARTAARQSAALTPAWLALAEPEDAILADATWQAAQFSDLCQSGLVLPRFVSTARESPSLAECQLVPWGWTGPVQEQARSDGRLSAGPPADLVAQVNQRTSRFVLEQSLKVALPGSGIVETLQELQLLVDQQPVGAPWIIKANFGMSGREALRGWSGALSDREVRWVTDRLQRFGPLVFEPMLDSVAEAGVQLEIPRSGTIQVIGVTEQLVAAGTWRGSRFEPAESTDSRWDEAVAVAQRVAAHLQSLGYFGPLGIDAMWYRDRAGGQKLRPLQDLNARFTMGRLTLGWRRLARAGECGAWLHLPAARLDARLLARTASLERESSRRARAIVTSPMVNGRPQTERASVLILAIDPAGREFGERWLLSE